MVEALYALADITADIHDCHTIAQTPLSSGADVSLIDDVISALSDTAHSEDTREILRSALARIAQMTLDKTQARLRQ